MTEARFRWDSRAALFVQGRRLGDGEPAPGLGADLWALRRAIADGHEFAVGADGVQVVSDTSAAPGFFRTSSGGSTGRAKSIRRAQASWIRSFDINRAHLGLKASDASAVLSQPAHSLGLYGVIEAAHIGADIHVLAGISPKRQAALINENTVTVLYATPTQLGQLARAGLPMPGLRHILCGGGRMPAGLAARIATLCPAATLIEFYGAAETSFVAWGAGDRPEGSVGKAYPGVEIRIDASAGGPGEIWVKSPYLFDSYAQSASAETRWRDGYLSVGEIGRLDRDGHLFITGRLGRRVTIADQSVSPEDIETLLLDQPGIGACAVLPVADARRGLVLIAVLSDAISDAATEQLLQLCRAKVGPLAAPRRVLVMPDFPLLASGKPDLVAIAKWLEGRA
ncbi:AMP-binding protein [Actibacterium sp.]|uniref:AMP-binding protein n=1 Tax=Actibacterium sp. TaxID=1872125 RepID=UPI0035636AE6